MPHIAFWTYKKSSRLPACQAQKRRLRHAQTAGPWRTDRACRQRPYCLTLLSEPTNSKALKDGLPNVAFWTYKKSSRLRAFQAQKRCLRHAQTAGPWRTDRACRQRPLLPNVAFWTYKKSSHLPAFQAQKRRLRWRTDRACRQRPLLPNVAFWTYKKAIVELSKLRNGASATPKQQGPEGRTGPAGNSPYCLTLLSEPTRQVALSETAPPPRPNSRALKDGQGLPATAPTA